MNTFLDIETCPDLTDGAMQRCIDSVEPPGQYKKAESIAEWKANNGRAVGEENWKRTALDPMYGGVLVIAHAIEDGDIRIVSREPDQPERKLLAEWADQIFEDLSKGAGEFRLPRFIGWNVADFDLRYLAIRCAILGVKLPWPLPIGARSDGPQVCDLMKIWAGFKNYQKQASVAHVLGIKLSDETDGAQLWEFVQRDGIAAAVRKCKSDVEALREIYARMRPIFGC